MRKKVTTTIYITEQQNEQLKALHARTKVPIAEYIRQGIDLILDRHASSLPGQLPLFDPQSKTATETPTRMTAQGAQAVRP